MIVLILPIDFIPYSVVSYLNKIGEILGYYRNVEKWRAVFNGCRCTATIYRRSYCCWRVVFFIGKDKNRNKAVALTIGIVPKLENSVSSGKS